MRPVLRSALACGVVALSAVGVGAWRWSARAASARDTVGDAHANTPLVSAPADVSGPAAQAERLPSGVASRVLRAGAGDQRPGLDDLVTIHATTWSRNGKLLGDSRTGGIPETISVAGMRPGLAEVVQRMVAGEVRRVWVPSALSTIVGDEDEPPPHRADLTVDLELIGLRQAPRRPTSSSQPMPSASSTASGLHYLITAHGGGTRAPQPNDTITFNHSGWRENGRLFESSRLAGQAQTARVSQMLPGLAEGVALMKVGDRALFWLPARLAYGEHPSRRAPKGPLMFELELLAIE